MYDNNNRRENNNNKKYYKLQLFVVNYIMTIRLKENDLKDF